MRFSKNEILPCCEPIKLVMESHSFFSVGIILLNFKLFINNGLIAILSFVVICVCAN